MGERPSAIYERLRLDLVALVRSVTPERRESVVPATPAWCVRDVLAHVIGIAADLNAGRFGEDDPDAWTAAQVDARRDRSLDELTTEWDVVAPTFERGLDLFGIEVGNHFVGDLAQHLVDVRVALGLEEQLPLDALRASLDFYLDDLDARMLARGVGIELVLDGMRWQLGPPPPVARLRTTGLEALRVIGGRRSFEEARALDWSGDVERVIGLLDAYAEPIGGQGASTR